MVANINAFHIRTLHMLHPTLVHYFNKGVADQGPKKWDQRFGASSGGDAIPQVEASVEGNGYDNLGQFRVTWMLIHSAY